MGDRKDSGDHRCSCGGRVHDGGHSLCPENSSLEYKRNTLGDSRMDCFVRRPMTGLGVTWMVEDLLLSGGGISDEARNVSSCSTGKNRSFLLGRLLRRTDLDTRRVSMMLSASLTMLSRMSEIVILHLQLGEK